MIAAFHTLSLYLSSIIILRADCIYLTRLGRPSSFLSSFQALPHAQNAKVALMEVPSPSAHRSRLNHMPQRSRRPHQRLLPVRRHRTCIYYPFRFLSLPPFFTSFKITSSFTLLSRTQDGGAYIICIHLVRMVW